MAGSSFGTLFRVATFGESHCKGVGAIVDGVPPGMRLTEEDIQPQLTRRRPGQSRLTTPRSETDKVTIMSGTERGVTLGTPICCIVPNENTRPGDYAEMSAIPRPGHADYTYLMKYGVAASSGGGRSSARETIGRVAGGAIAEKWLAQTYGTRIVTFVSSVGPVDLPAEVMQRPDGSPWSREDVDRLGTLTLLRDYATGWRCLRAEREAAGAAAVAAGGGGAAAVAPTAAAGAPPPEEKASQAAHDAADEAAFVAAYRLRCPDEAGAPVGAASADGAAEAAATAAAAGHAVLASAGRAGGAYGPGTPCYEGGDGSLYDLDGARIPDDALAARAAAWAASVGRGSAGAAGSAPVLADYLAAIRSDEVVALRCPHAPTAARMASHIRLIKAEEDSTGGVLSTVVGGVPVGLGEPVFDKAEALLAHAMLSLPATKGFEVGSGFAGTRLRGSQHNDRFVAVSAGAGAGASSSGRGGGAALLRTATNNAGGTLGGITSGGELRFRVPIKPVSTIGRAQVTAAYGGGEAVLEAKGRHDPCVLPRAPPLVEAMTALVLADLALMQRARAPGGHLQVLPDDAGGVAAAAAAALDGRAAASDAAAQVGQKRRMPALP